MNNNDKALEYWKRELEKAIEDKDKSRIYICQHKVKTYTGALV